MRKKIKLIVGEELYDIGPAILISLLAIASIVALIIESLPFDF